jgi:acyl-CoA thioester hydrolase
MTESQNPETERRTLLSRESAYHFWTAEKIRFQDVDRFDHVNNVTFAAYAESGRVEFLEHVAPASVLGDARAEGGAFWVIARLTVEFHEQTHYPGEIRVGTGVLKIGRSSVTLGQGLFEGSRCVSSAESVIVLLDGSSNRSVALPREMRTALEAHQLR